MATVDLDAARAARREAKNEAPKVTFGGREFVMPIEMPFGVVVCLGRMAEAETAKDNGSISAIIVEILKLLLGDEYDAFMALGPSEKDITALVNGIVTEYGFADSGERRASPSSSKRTGKVSRPTSKRSTA